MKLLLQRVSRAAVMIDGLEFSRIGKGALVFAGVEKGDTLEQAGALARKLAAFRMFEDGQGKMNLSVKEAGGEVLVVSQFTLAADVRKGTRPGFDPAEKPERAREIIEAFNGFLREAGVSVSEGKFGAHMDVELVNDGPVTFILEEGAKT